MSNQGAGPPLKGDTAAAGPDSITNANGKPDRIGTLGAQPGPVSS